MLNHVQASSESEENDEPQAVLESLSIENFRRIYNYESLITCCCVSIKHLSFKEGLVPDDSSESDRDI